MATDSEQLVRLITEKVMAALRSGNAATPHLHAVNVHPPIGECTGDYSKFPELKGKNLGAPPPSSAPTPAPTPNPQPPTPAAPRGLTGIVTARQIASARTVVYLAPGARLTPLAADEVKSRKLKIERVGESSGSSGPVKPAAPFAWWISGACPVVDSVVPTYAASLSPLSFTRQPNSLVPAIREIARQVASGKAAGGVLFVPSAALAACFANRCPNLRAVVGTCVGAVEEGVRLLGANVLIVEYPQQGFKGVHAMLECFVTEPRAGLPDVDRQLKELGACGGGEAR
jgi:hypothetical protein